MRNNKTAMATFCIAYKYSHLISLLTARGFSWAETSVFQPPKCYTDEIHL